MDPIGIFFGTDSGTTRLIAKKIGRSLKARVGEELVAKPLSVNRVTVEDFLAHPALILGTPTYGEGVLPGKASKNSEASWLEFLPKLDGQGFSGKRVALFGLGDQEQYPDHFLSAMIIIGIIIGTATKTKAALNGPNGAVSEWRVKLSGCSACFVLDAMAWRSPSAVR